jgi:hypothetical protein
MAAQLQAVGTMQANAHIHRVPTALSCRWQDEACVRISTGCDTGRLMREPWHDKWQCMPDWNGRQPRDVHPSSRLDWYTGL